MHGVINGDQQSTLGKQSTATLIGFTYRGGKLLKDTLNTIALNSRNPNAFRLDLEAMIAALKIGQRRMHDLDPITMDLFLHASLADFKCGDHRFQVQPEGIWITRVQGKGLVYRLCRVTF